VSAVAEVKIKAAAPATGLSPRLARARERAVNLTDSFPRGERLRLYTESYRRTAGQPVVLRQARAYAHYLENIPIRVFAGERLAIQPQRYQICHPGLQPAEIEWVRMIDWPERTGGTTWRPEFAPPELLAYLEEWREGLGPHCNPWERLSAPMQQAQRLGVLSAGGMLSGHCVPGFRRVLERGLRGIVEEARAKPAALPADDEGGRHFLEALVISCEAVLGLGQRYAEAARDQAARESSAAARRDWEELGELAARIPAEPAETFHEALQCIWAVQRATEMEQGDSAVATSFGRLDQYLYPYYEADLAAGRITRESAKELLTEFYLRLVRLYSDQHVLVGGVGPDGEDATNELSHLILEIAGEQRLLVDIGARVHSGTPQAFWEQCADLMRLNLGFSMFGDEPSIEGLVARGFPIERARDYAVVGCVEYVVPEVQAPRTVGHMLNMPKILELALHEGRCALTGEQVGPRTGDPRSFRRFEELWDAYAEQASYFVELAAEATNALTLAQSEAWAVPFLSATFEDPIRLARDLSAGGAQYNHVGVQFIGLANVADSLAAMRELVFETGSLSADEVLRAVDADFAGQEALRQRLLKSAPKYGNSIPAVDELAADLVQLHVDELGKHRTAYGDRFLPLSLGTNVACVRVYGPKTAALPDGRHARTPIAAALGPAQGRDARGVLAALQSILRLPHYEMAGGASFILEVHPSGLAKTDEEDKLLALLRTYFELGGINLTINVIGPEMLREAQEEPERFRSLSVRLFGYSDYFVNLDRDLQEYVIAKAEKSA